MLLSLLLHEQDLRVFGLCDAWNLNNNKRLKWQHQHLPNGHKSTEYFKVFQKNQMRKCMSVKTSGMYLVLFIKKETNDFISK